MISPFALRYAEAMVLRHFYALERVNRLCGVSLFNTHYSEVLEQSALRSPDVISGGVYLYQYPQSWGALYSPQCWRNFTDYAIGLIESNTDPLLPNSYTNRWPASRSWMKYLFR